MFSRKAKYGLIACIRLAREEYARPLLIRDIAESEQLPQKFLETILLDLRYAGLLVSKKGRGGGYLLARPANQISMAEVIKAIDGPLIPFRCIAIRSDKTCEECVSAATCSIRVAMEDVSRRLRQMLGDETLADLAAKANGHEPSAALILSEGFKSKRIATSR